MVYIKLSGIGRFASADSIVPNAANPQSFNRYAYVYNNPIKFSDPSGHCLPLECPDTPKVGPRIPNSELSELEDLERADALLYMILYLEAELKDTGGVAAAWGDINALQAALAQEAYMEIIANSELAKREAIENAVFEELITLIILLPGASLNKTPSDTGFIGGTVAEEGGEALWVRLKRYVSGGCSFSADTLVMTDDGLAPISEVPLGELVLAFNEETGEVDYYPVVAVWAHEDPVIVFLTIEGETIVTTPDHPFFTLDGEWIQAGNLQVGDELKDSNYAVGTVEEVYFTRTPQTMYNFTVASAHTYFVGEGQWLVHNSCLHTKSSRIKAAQLPNSGRIRYIPPENYHASMPLPRGQNNGYIDKFGNEWVRGPSRTAGEPFEWDVQLSRTGKEQLGWASPDGNHLNVSLNGHITH